MSCRLPSQWARLLFLRALLGGTALGDIHFHRVPHLRRVDGMGHGGTVGPAAGSHPLAVGPGQLQGRQRMGLVPGELRAQDGAYLAARHQQAGGGRKVTQPGVDDGAGDVLLCIHLRGVDAAHAAVAPALVELVPVR
jgi:hypothetical protein